MGMSRKNYLKGRRFGSLLVIEDLDEKDKFGRYYVKCKCDCGNETKVLNISLLRLVTTSCGCGARLMKEVHIDNTNIRIKNLNPAKNNTSGIKGVSYNKKIKKWKAYLTFQKNTYYEFFEDKEDAIKYRKELEEKYFKPKIEEWKEKGIIK